MQTEVILNAETESEVLAIHKIKYTAAPQGGDFNLDQKDTCPGGKGEGRDAGTGQENTTPGNISHLEERPVPEHRM